MNFKPTKWKVVWGIVISIVISIISIVSLIFKQKCITKDFEPAGICPGWTTTAIFFIGLFFILLTFILIYICWRLIGEVFQNIKKKRLNLSVSISLIFFWISIFMSIGGLTSQRGFTFREYYFTISNFILNIFVSLFISLILSAILFFLIYIVWKILEKSEFFRPDLKKILVLLVLMSPIIIQLSLIIVPGTFYHRMHIFLLPARFSFLNMWIIISNGILEFIWLLFYGVCGAESCSVPGALFSKVLAYSFFVVVHYFISCLIIFSWNFKYSDKKLKLYKKIALIILLALFLIFTVLLPAISPYF